MNTQHELPDYLQAILDEAKEYQSDSDQPASAVAHDVATEQRGLVSNRHGQKNLDVLMDLRDAGALCTDELEHYQKFTLADDVHDATIEAIVTRSLEELLHDTLTESR